MIKKHNCTTHDTASQKVHMVKYLKHYFPDFFVFFGHNGQRKMKLKTFVEESKETKEKHCLKKKKNTQKLFNPNICSRKTIQ